MLTIVCTVPSSGLQSFTVLGLASDRRLGSAELGQHLRLLMRLCVDPVRLVGFKNNAPRERSSVLLLLFRRLLVRFQLVLFHAPDGKTLKYLRRTLIIFGKVCLIFL